MFKNPLQFERGAAQKDICCEIYFILSNSFPITLISAVYDIIIISQELGVSSCRWHQLSDLLLQHRLHLLALQVVSDGGEEVAGVVALQRAAAVRERRHDGLVVAEDLQAAQEQRLALASWHHHLEEEGQWDIYLETLQE